MARGYALHLYPVIMNADGIFAEIPKRATSSVWKSMLESLGFTCASGTAAELPQT